jgi:hypothetical protein
MKQRAVQKPHVQKFWINTNIFSRLMAFNFFSVLCMLIDICLFTLCYAFVFMRECMISYLMSEI